MQAFRRHGCVAVCTFELAEIDLLESLASQLIELLLDEAAAPAGPVPPDCSRRSSTTTPTTSSPGSNAR